MRITSCCLFAFFVSTGCGEGAGDTADAGVPTIFINEIVPSNATGLEDNGTYPDWLELYNPGAAAVDLAGWTLTDDPANQLKWTFTTGATVPAKGYLVVIADSDDEGDLHTNFNLEQTGEYVGLYAPLADGGVLVDSIDYPAVATDYAYGRMPDGDPSWAVLAPPTPGAANRLDEQPAGGAR